MKQSAISIRLQKVNTKQIVEAVHIVERFRAEKDETDTELAVDCALTYHPEQIILTGVTVVDWIISESALHLLYRLQMNISRFHFRFAITINELSMLIAGCSSIERKMIVFHMYLFFLSVG